VEKFAKRKEPLYYRKYSNVKTADDAKNLMDSITQRQKALSNLEIMTYKKYLNLSHELKIRAWKNKAMVVNKPNFGVVFQTIRDRLSATTSTASTTQSVVERERTAVTDIDFPQMLPPRPRGFSYGGIDNPAFEEIL